MALNLDIKIQLGLRAHELATRYALVDRLPEGLLERLVQDVQHLQDAMSATSTARQQIGMTTTVQREALRRAHGLIRGVRLLARKGQVSADTRKRYGVGVSYNPRVHHQVVSALEQILTRMAEAPEEAQQIGLMPEDATRLKAVLVEVNKADKEQREALLESPRTTASRTEIARRLTAAVGRVVAAGLTRFANEPAALEFANLGGVALNRRKKRLPTSGGTESDPKAA